MKMLFSFDTFKSPPPPPPIFFFITLKLQASASLQSAIIGFLNFLLPNTYYKVIIMRTNI